MEEDRKSRMIESIKYQDNAIVSRTIIDRETGTITLFALDKGQKISEHTTPYDAFVLILEGKANIIISGEDHSVKYGEMIIMPAGEPHAIEATERFKMLLVMIRSN